VNSSAPEIDLPHNLRPAWPHRREGPLQGDQATVPSEDRVGRHDGRDLPQDPSAESASPRREAAALVIGQPEAAPLQLLLQDAVLLYQVLDNVLLVAIDPPREGQEQHLQRRESGLHWSILPGVGTGQRSGRVFGHHDGLDPHAARQLHVARHA
jgi:hypothetical protein